MSKRSYPVGDLSRRASLYGKAVTRRAGGLEHADTFGTDLAMRPAAPPPVAAYDEYLRNRNVRQCVQHHRCAKTGTRLRRIVIMRRAGASWKECGEAVGISGSAAREWVEFLPYELGV